MSLIPYRTNSYIPSRRQSNSVIEWAFNLANRLTYHAHYIYYWLRDIAPILIQCELRQAGRNAIDDLPLLSWGTKQEIKRWLIDYCGL